MVQWTTCNPLRYQGLPAASEAGKDKDDINMTRLWTDIVEKVFRTVLRSCSDNGNEISLLAFPNSVLAT